MIFDRPALGTVSSHFSPSRFHPIEKVWKSHTGVDIRKHDSDNRIFAGASGTVTRAEKIGTYGNAIYINHGNGYITRYAHLKSFNVKAGQRVSRGQVIAVKGNTGNSTGVHLHFEVRINGVAKNPIGYTKGFALKNGIVGSRVRLLQNRLNKLGHKLAVDSSFGPATEKAVRTFQSKYKLAVDGMYGPASEKKMDKLFAETKKTIAELAKEVIAGKWGVGADRKKRLTDAGYDYAKVQAEVNRIVGGSTSIKVGSKVKIKSSAKNYTRTKGTVAIPARIKGKTYTVSRIDGNDVLLKEIVSWVCKSDVQ